MDKLNDEKVTEVEAMLIALDSKQARQLASDIIFKVQGGVWEWGAATKHEDYMSRRIPLIRELEAIMD